MEKPEETNIETLSQGKDIGVIAQDVEKVFLGLFHNVKVTDENGTEKHSNRLTMLELLVF
ncbi:tail fiber domain-containing protein [Spartinivicinus ruber]|uniref:tail fiber domain-containing protein n=1 Tax=Spartinivicinus ruber TaxID=2683272 RepID=UPI0013D75972|nr:tail fiber domain-containing protein [Spartinivicinus ruber]